MTGKVRFYGELLVLESQIPLPQITSLVSFKSVGSRNKMTEPTKRIHQTPVPVDTLEGI